MRNSVRMVYEWKKERGRFRRLASASSRSKKKRNPAADGVLVLWKGGRGGGEAKRKLGGGRGATSKKLTGPLRKMESPRGCGGKRRKNSVAKAKEGKLGSSSNIQARGACKTGGDRRGKSGERGSSFISTSGIQAGERKLDEDANG